MGAQVFLLGLVEAFDFAAGLGVIGAGVVVSDAEFAEDDFQGGAAVAALSGGEDGAVVGEQASGGAPGGDGGQEGVDDVGAGRDGACMAGDGQPGVVVEDVEDFHGGAIGEVPVGDVGLPSLVGLFGFKANPRGAGTFLRLRCDESAAGQHRQIVDTAGTFGVPGSRWRCSKMVVAPAS